MPRAKAIGLDDTPKDRERQLCCGRVPCRLLSDVKIPSFKRGKIPPTMIVLPLVIVTKQGALGSIRTSVQVGMVRLEDGPTSLVRDPFAEQG